MNHSYIFPPQGIVYITPQLPGPPFIVPGAQFSPHASPPRNGHPPGHAPPLAQTHVPPGVVYSQHSNIANNHMNLHANYQVDAGGWYYNAPQLRPNPPGTGASQHPPGLPMPPHIISKPTSGEKNTTTITKASSSSNNLHLHEFWRGRLAPLPGYQSRPGLLPMKETKRVKIESEHQRRKKGVSSLALLPPKSFSGPSSRRELRPSPLLDDKEEQKQTKHFQFDKYAEIFVPQYLKNIQKHLHNLEPLSAIPVFPSITYLQTYLFPGLIEGSIKSSDNLALLSAPPIPPTAKVPTLDNENYYDHWAALLRWELDTIALQKEQIVLWKLGLKVAVWQDAEFLLYVPGIRENHPRLEVGDLVHMREVIEVEQRGSNLAFEGRVVALRMRQGVVHISSPTLKRHMQTYLPPTPTTTYDNGLIAFGPDDAIPLAFNVTFMVNARPMCLMEAATRSIAELLSVKEAGTNLIRQWIFPDLTDLDYSAYPMLNTGVIEKSEWVDQGLNREQRMAVTSISLYQSPVPHLISGPPGTGKTRTVVEAVLQIFRAQPDACILLCAPSNPATDTLVLRLRKHLLQHEMIRINDQNRTFAEVPDVIKPYCYVENDKFALPPWKKLMGYRVVVCSCLDANILVGAQCTNRVLMAMEDEIMSTLHPHRQMTYVAQPHWTHLLIDEAAQGSEPELLIPISVVAPPVCENNLVNQKFMPQLTLCGDVNQLGPIVASEEARSAELEISLLERLFDRPLYSMYTQDVLGSATSHRVPPPYTNLVKNYRSHPVILMPPSAIFYNDSLLPFARNGRIFWSGLANPLLPLKFIGIDSREESNDERASWFNPGEINQVADVIKAMLSDSANSDPPLHPKEIGVMAPWREQVWKLRERLRNDGLSAVDVGTVEDYQGRESRVVIISCVRSNPRFVEEDIQKGLGLVFERKRMNVAITRARELLVVIGNGALLQRDPYWKSFLKFTIRNKLYVGPELDMEMDGNYISRLESQLVHSGTGPIDLDLDIEEQGVVVAGGVAREVLRE